MYTERQGYLLCLFFPLPCHRVPKTSSLCSASGKHEAEGSYRHTQNQKAERINKTFLTKVLVDSRLELLNGIFSVSQQHVGIFLQENWIVDSSIASRQRSLHDDHSLRIPHAQDRHASNLTVRVIFCGTIDSVVGCKEEETSFLRPRTSR